MNTNTAKNYQNECPLPEGFARDLCLVKYKWIDYVTVQSFPEDSNAKQAYFSDSLRFDTNRRPINQAENYYNDCRGRARKIQRPVPTNCYGTRYNDNWESTKYFLWEIRADLMYTFDNVLWDNLEANRRENQFWYLILYLKTLVTLIENPVDIVNVVSYRVRDTINELLLRVDKLEQRLPLLSTINKNGYTVVNDNIGIIKQTNNYTLVDDVIANLGNIEIKP